MITLIGKELAQKGVEFVYLGSVEECENCRFKSSCVDSLELNRKYVITDVKDTEQKCPVHSQNIVIPVEIERAQIDVLTPSKNIFEGSTFTYEAPKCDEYCEFHDLCFPEGLVENDKCIVIKNQGKHKECKKGYALNKLTLAFVI
ncbi:MAG: UPF0179 family protein [Methanobrevibacter sp.]|uniref:UPF0179 family protein n=1 Tax=uncultured Methanobrevibacter sp. TaxID=253161 RepID=UPI0025D01620|nr:UPF0179 family protein [uncultured Methanobrevibacter sp.]MBQ2612863.1 UPF0179 family protein [Methanobrevibacter sp.]